jgi:hypothetical protein
MHIYLITTVKSFEEQAPELWLCPTLIRSVILFQAILFQESLKSLWFVSVFFGRFTIFRSVETVWLSLQKTAYLKVLQDQGTLTEVEDLEHLTSSLK